MSAEADSIRVLGYGRISDADDDDETSLEGQRDDVEEYCKEHGYKLVKWKKPERLWWDRPV
ncbi:recombinase family protein [Halosolutus halophilus]|uniref:recombinase family protein n=1 Tax=Halosolutus halophilus TaxID=1552990 RepID=UPI002234EDA1|nr:recombinase family protein [Halosolutus halophilus]